MIERAKELLSIFKDADMGYSGALGRVTCKKIPALFIMAIIILCLEASTFASGIFPVFQTLLGLNAVRENMSYE